MRDRLAHPHGQTESRDFEPRLTSAHLIGRQNELAILDTALNQAKSGRGMIVVVDGEVQIVSYMFTM